MTDLHYVPLPHRGAVFVSGQDAKEFLQGLVTNDMEEVSRDRAIYAALLTPQGKFLHEFFVIEAEDGFRLDCERERRADLIARLSRYKLRARVDIGDAGDDYAIFALTGRDVAHRLRLADKEGAAAPFAGGVVYNDPRLPDLGARACLPSGTGEKALRDAGFEEDEPASYDTRRFSLGVADGSPEIEPEKAYPMEYGLDRFHGISFSKGCYVGQEVTVRMKNRDLTRKCLAPVRIDGTPPAIGTQLTLDGATAGELRGVSGGTGLALVRKELLDQALANGEPFLADGARLYPG